jgi:hypothetical protein
MMNIKRGWVIFFGVVLPLALGIAALVFSR